MIVIKSSKEIALMSVACELTGRILDELKELIKPGISTLDIDRWIDSYITKNNMKSAFKGYGGFPATACISVNEEVIHGIPSAKRILKEGDIVSVDMGTVYKDYNSDAARTYSVGKLSEENARLIATAEESFFEGIKFAKKGYRIGDISHAIQTCVESNGFSVIRDYVGHGVGRRLHEDPQIPNYGKPNRGPQIVPGMTLAIEPMIAAGSFEVGVLDNDWTVVTLDASMAAHYENTVLITEDEPIILTCPEWQRQGRPEKEAAANG